MATSFFSEISYHFKRIRSKIKFTWFGSRKSWFFFLLLFKMVRYSVFLAIFIFLFPGGMASLRHSPSSSSETLHRRICQRSCHYFAFHQNGGLAQPKPLDKISQDYKQWFFSGLFTTPKHRHHSFTACFEQKQENEKNKRNNNNKGCQEIIGLIRLEKIQR